MPLVVKDRVKVTSTTTGTGTFTLGAAVAGFQDFSVLTPNTAWNIGDSVYLQSKSITSQDLSPQGLFFKDDGTKMYFVGATNDSVYEYDLSTAWDVSTATYLQSFSVSAQDTVPTDIFFKPDGLKMYIVGNSNNSVYEYDLSSAWNISTATYLQSFSVNAQETNPLGLFFKPDGLKMYICGDATNDIFEYNLSSAWNVSTASYLQNFEVGGSAPNQVFFKPDGSKMYVAESGSDAILEYNLSSAWNITSSIFVQSFSIAAQDNIPAGLFFKPDGLKMYVLGGTNDSVFEYNIVSSNQTYYGITNGTDWEIGIGTSTYGGSGSTLSRDTVFESSNSNNKVDWAAGTKDVFCTFPADATEGTVPQGDTSQVGTDLVAWTNLKKELDRTTINGVPYANNSTNGIVSTYSLVYTASGSYRGGILAPNGDIYFIPYNANRGQKVSATGVVSTYSLVYTVASAYSGGVLAPNGDIHFVPYAAVRGQKISASGVVSTYSLVYTNADAYSGGVLAPNGDIHFIPFAANRGQKVSAAGVVSTYSLVYTNATGAYVGGVLAPNGDIHFVPDNANRGQKVSAAGVVSTYSLIYTTASAYNGGVLAPNGDIHFIPLQANRGQKISLAGVVSTYSLVYTANGAYKGGVLAPNGDIHFVPSEANRGQKISSAGVVSTYSLVYTVGGSYVGGVLTPNGDINFIPANAVRGQAISTNVQQKVGYALSPFFNKL
jgi:hypothetical protein